MTSSINKETQVKSSAIYFGALIGIGFWMILAIFGGALGMSLQHRAMEWPSNSTLAMIAILAILVLTATFFLAGFIASKVAHQQMIFDSVIHSLGTWALMTLLLAFLVAFATATKGLREAFDGMSPPAFVTDVEVFKAKAVTTFKEGHKSEKPTRQERRANKVFEVIWWVCFSSMLLGMGTSILGGLLGRKVTLRAIIKEAKK